MKIISGSLFRFSVIIVILGNSLSVKSQTRKNDSIPQIRLPEVVISALRLPFKESSVPYSISLLSARSNTQGLSLAESIAGLPGLEVNARYNYAVGDRITNRGFGARTQFGVRGIRIVFDDMPVTFADGQSNLEMIDLQNLSTVEFLRGPGSSLYGNASGGVLILHSKAISDNRFLASASTTIGSSGLLRWNGLIEGKAGKANISGSFSDFQYDGFRSHASAEYKRAFFKLLSDLSSKNNLQIEAGAVKFNSLNPGSLTKEESDIDPARANPSSISNAAGQDGKQFQISGTLRHRTDSVTQFKLTLYGIHRSVVNPIIGKIVVLPQYSGGVVASLNSIFQFAHRTIDWSAGLEIAARFNKRKNFLNNAGEEGDIIINQLEQVIGTGLFLQLSLPVNARLDIDACLRYDLNYFGAQNRLITAADSGNSVGRFMNALNPSVGLIYRLFDKLRLFTNISTSFETPTSTELVNRPDGAGGFNPDLNPSRAVEYEAGIRGYINPLLAFDIAGYIIRTKDELIPFQVPDTPGQDYFRNAGSTVHRGGEFTFRYSPVSFMDISASLTYINAYYKNFIVKGIDYSRNKIPGISKIHGVSEIKFHLKQGMYFSFLTQSYGKMNADDANTATSKRYILCDIGIGHEGLNLGTKQVKRIILSGGISNIFNIHYITSVSVNAAANRYFEPGPGRTFYLNARVDFGIR